MSDCVVAVDLGNSAVKLCVNVPTQGQECEADCVEHAISLDEPQWSESAVDWLEDQIGERSAQWRIASVHRSASQNLQQAIVARKEHDSVCLITRHSVPMPLRVDYPDQLGIDRLIAAYAASLRLGSPLVVVDAGSAVTVDWINADGEFCGGAIIPGMGLQFSALASGTDALPQLDPDQVGSLRAPARNTAEAIRLGVLTSISAGIDRLGHQYFQLVPEGENQRLVLTGGDSKLISPHLTLSHVVEPNLVCRGLLDLPRSSLVGTNPSEELE